MSVEELKLIAYQPQCGCGGQCFPLADYHTEWGGVIVRRQCRMCGNVMWQLQKIEALSAIKTVTEFSSERVIKKTG